VSYREVGVPTGRTFIINPKGQICKGSAVLQSSTWSSLSAINSLVDEMFPAVQVGRRVSRGPRRWRAGGRAGALRWGGPADAL
jgi:phosphatidate phosphatase PAH1